MALLTNLRQLPLLFRHISQHLSAFTYIQPFFFCLKSKQLYNKGDKL